jgi:hypothetical protein
MLAPLLRLLLASCSGRSLVRITEGTNLADAQDQIWSDISQYENGKDFSGTLRKKSESGIFGTHFLKMQILRFHDLIAKIGIAKIGILILMIDPDRDPNVSDSRTLLTP